MSTTGTKSGGGNERTGAAALPPDPRFTPACIKGNLAEAMLLRTIGHGQPIKASWLCQETLSVFRHHHMPPDLDLVNTLRVLVLCYTDAIKQGHVEEVHPADEALVELATLGGIPDADRVMDSCRRDGDFDPVASLGRFKVAVRTGGDRGDPQEFTTPYMQFPVARVSGGAATSADGFLVVDGVEGAEVLVDSAVRTQARFEALYLRGVVAMSQALRVERSSHGTGGGLLKQELSFLVVAAWWMHLAGLVSEQAAVDPDECGRKARARTHMLVRRIETGRHFEMPTIEPEDMLE